MKISCTHTLIEGLLENNYIDEDNEFEEAVEKAEKMAKEAAA